MSLHHNLVTDTSKRNATVSYSLHGIQEVLTAREHEVLVLYLRIINDKKVARELGTRPQTVRNQLASIQHKLGVCSRVELISSLIPAIKSDLDYPDHG
jgi:DNA-binding CsgD family transcriptional regulator